MGEAAGWIAAAKVFADSSRRGAFTGEGWGDRVAAERGVYGRACSKSGVERTDCFHPPDTLSQLFGSCLYPFKSIEEEVSFDACVLVAVAAMDGVLAYVRRIELTDGTSVCLGRVGGADELTEIG